MTQSNKKSAKNVFSQGNKALRIGDYRKAITLYAQVLAQQAELPKHLPGNLSIARRKYSLSRKAIAKPNVVVCGWDLGHNAAGRVYTLATLYETLTNVEIIGSLFPIHSRNIWEPIRATSIAKNTFVVEDDSKFIEQALKIVAEHPCDILHLSKPRIPNIFFGIMYKLLWDAKVLMDIDDEELAFVDEETPISIDSYLNQYGKLPELKNLAGKDWTRLAVGYANVFDGITVANHALQQRYGGEIIRHARNETLFKISSQKRQLIRARHGIAADAKVILFLGTPRSYKGLVGIGQAISRLKRRDTVFAIVGDFPDDSLKAQLQAISNVNYVFIGNQPISEVPEIISIGDICVLMQNSQSTAARYQTPAKLSDALASNLPVLATDIPSLSGAFKAGALLPINKNNLAEQLSKVLDNENIAQNLRQNGIDFFRSELSFSANIPRLSNAVQKSEVKSLSADIDALGRYIHNELFSICRRYFCSKWKSVHKEDLGYVCGNGAPYSLNGSDNVKKPDSNKCVVSILCRTYNQVNFISKALDGFVMQKTDFTYEVLIGDDLSTDGTEKIIQQYQRKYPEILKIISRTENLGPIPNLKDLTKFIKGKYVAVCEGDDYWIDEHKLQKQVDFLDKNPDYSVCFNQVIINYLDSDEANTVAPKNVNETSSFDDLIKGNYIYMNSVMYRWGFPSGLNEQNFNSKAMPADWQLHLHHALKGKIKLLDFIGGVYNRHSAGIWSCSKNPIELHVKFGIAEIEFYKTFEDSLEKRHYRFLKDKQIYIFRLLVNHYFEIEDYANLCNLINYDKNMFEKIFKDLGYETEQIDISSPSKLYDTLKSQNTVDVIVTSFNHQSYIRQCLESIILQKGCFSLKIIIGDDASSDDTLNIVRKIKRSHPKTIQIIPPEINLGMHKNLERCFKKCTAKYTAICEGDDYWLSRKKIQKQLMFLRNNQNCSMCFNWLLLFKQEEGNYIPHPQQEKLNKKNITFQELSKQPIIGNFSACFYDAEAIKTVPKKYYDNPMGFDWLFNMNIAKVGNVGFLKELLSVYRIHKNGLWSGNNKESMKLKIRNSQNNFIKYFGDGKELSGLKNGLMDNLIRNNLTIEETSRIKFDFNRFIILGDKIEVIGWMYEKLENKMSNKISKGICFLDTKKNLTHIYYMNETLREDVTKTLRTTTLIDPLCGFNEHFKIPLTNNGTYSIGLCYDLNNFLYYTTTNIKIEHKNNAWIILK